MTVAINTFVIDLQSTTDRLA